MEISEVLYWIGWLKWDKKVEFFKITESFGKGNISFIVNSLSVGLEKNVVFMVDKENNLFKERFPVIAFLTESVVSVHKYIVFPVFKFEFQLKDGTILIENI